MKENLFVFDLGGSSIKYGIWEAEKLHPLGAVATPESWNKMKQLLADKLSEYPGKNIKGVAISCPGSVDLEEGIVYGTSAIPYIHRFPVRRELEDFFGLPVSLQNDANCAALAEVWMGNAKSVKNACFVIIGSGIGGAVIADGKLQSGAHLFGGEFGYQIINDQTLLTLSEAGSPVTMANNFTKWIADGHRYEGKEVFELAEAGNSLAEKMVNDLYDSLSIGIYNLQLCFDPERILIGGGMSGRPDLIEQLQQRVGRLLTKKGAGDLDFDLKPCRYFSDSNMLGAIYQFHLENRQ